MAAISVSARARAPFLRAYPTVLKNQSGENKDDSEYNEQLDEGERAGALLTAACGGPVRQPFDTGTLAGSGETFYH